jgi:hypothetical protein
MGEASSRIGYFSDVIFVFAFHRDRRGRQEKEEGRGMRGKWVPKRWETIGSDIREVGSTTVRRGWISDKLMKEVSAEEKKGNGEKSEKRSNNDKGSVTVPGRTSGHNDICGQREHKSWAPLPGFPVGG